MQYTPSLHKNVKSVGHYLRVLGAAVRHLPAREDLPAQDAVGPHVALAREPREIQHLRKINTVRDHVIVSQIQKELRVVYGFDHPYHDGSDFKTMLRQVLLNELKMTVRKEKIGFQSGSTTIIRPLRESLTASAQNYIAPPPPPPQQLICPFSCTLLHLQPSDSSE
jgi:hypothetical protein